MATQTQPKPAPVKDAPGRHRLDPDKAHVQWRVTVPKEKR